MPTPTPPPAGTPDQLALLRADLTEAPFTVEHVADLLGPVAGAALHRNQPLPALRITEQTTDPAAALVRLFTLGRPVPATTLDRALPRTGARGLVRLGLAAPAGTGSLRAAGDLRPYGDEEHTWWVASDFGEPVLRGPLPTDHVLGVGGASTTLAAWTPRHPVARALDLGTGCGIQSLHLAGAGQAAAVTATDISERALAFARFTAGLNGIPLDLRAGSLLEPVAEEEFDLIVSNPPFVITPRSAAVPRYEYRDGGGTGDQLVAGLVQGVAGHLAPEGMAVLLGNWETAAGQTWQDRVGSWVAGSGLDAWVVQRESQDPAEYAETWIRDGGHLPGTPEFEQLYAAWLDDFAARAVHRVGFGIVVLHRPGRDRATWLDLEEIDWPLPGAKGPAVLAGVRARSWLAEHEDRQLLDTAWAVVTDVTEERVGRPGAPDPAVIQLRQGGGLGRTVRLDTVGAALVGVCDGELTAGQALTAIAALTEADTGATTTAGVRQARELIAAGILVPAGAAVG